MKKTKILFLITGLNQGGAEKMLYNVVKTLPKKKFSILVVSLTSPDIYGNLLEKENIRVVCLNMKKNIFISLIKYFKVIKHYQPDIIQGWMYHANLLAMLGKLFSFKSKILFNIRHSLSNLSHEKKMTKLTIKLNALFSKFAHTVINNSKVSIAQHIKAGFYQSNNIYLPNGFDIDLFKPNRDLYIQFRKKYNLSPDTKIIINIARFHPMKNHLGFLEICQIIKSNYNHKIKFFMAGNTIDKKNQALINKIKSLNMTDDCVLLGSIKSFELLPAVDVYLSSSLWGEGFPNVIGEAMACGVPCVATDVGDCELIIDKYGHTAKPGANEQLANYCLDLLNNPKYAADQIRQHIVDNYSIDHVIKQYEDIYMKVMEQ